MIRLSVAICLLPLVLACSHSDESLPEDTSLSGGAAGTVGAALALANPGGAIPANAFLERTWDALVPSAFAGLLCPTFRSASGSGCTAVGGNSVSLTLSNCSRGTSGSTSFTGTFEFQVTGSGFSVACGIGVSGSGAGYVSGGTFSNGAGTAGATGAFISASGTKITIDESTSGLSNYQNDSLTSISTNLSPGTGNAVTWASGVRTAVAFHRRLTVGKTIDYSLTTNGSPLTVTETADSSSRSVSGTATTYDNLLKVKGSTTFTGVTYQNSCCGPVGGAVTTVYSSTAGSGSAGQALNGKSETLKFNSCGTGTFTNAAGVTSSVTIDWCI